MRRSLVIFSGLALWAVLAVLVRGHFSRGKWIEHDFVRVKVPRGWTEWITPAKPTQWSGIPSIEYLTPQMPHRYILPFCFSYTIP